MTKILTRAPAETEIVLAIWPGESGPSVVGNGDNRTSFGESCATLMLHVRLIHTPSMEFASSYSVNTFSDALRDLALRVFFYRDDNGYGPSAEWLGHHVYYAKASQLMQMAKLIDKFNDGASKLYVGGKETTEGVIRRLLAGAGIKKAVLIGGGPELKTCSVDYAMTKHVLPVVEQLRRKLSVA